MPKILTEAAIAGYRDEGYLFPLPVLDADGVSRCRQQLEAFESRQGEPIGGAQRSKSHLLFKWIDELMRHHVILDAVEDLIGPDLLCWNTLFWVKEAGSESFVSWHQDLRYWGLDTSDLVTVWLALSPATSQSGCMRVLPRSHVGELMPHADEYQTDNMLTRGQEISVDVDESQAVEMPLQPGEASLHNGRLAHASGPNRSADRRIGLSLHEAGSGRVGQCRSGARHRPIRPFHPHTRNLRRLRACCRGVPRTRHRGRSSGPVHRSREGPQDAIAASSLTSATGASPRRC